MKKGVFFSATLILVLFFLLSINYYFIFISSSQKNLVTGNVIAEDSNGKYLIEEIAELPSFLWYLSTNSSRIYTGVYGDEGSGKVNRYYYADPPYNEWKNTIISSNDEATRPFNFADTSIIISEGGVVWVNESIKCFDFKNHFVLAAEKFQGMNLVLINPKINSKNQASGTELYDCQCSGGISCRKVFSFSDPKFVFDIRAQGNKLFLIGSGQDYRTTSGGKVFVFENGKMTKLIDGGVGAGAQIEFFDDRVFFGFSYNNKVISYKNNQLKEEISFPNMEHFGDFAEFDDKLFISVTKEGGNPEIYYREKDSLGGQWKLVFNKSQLSKYGMLGRLFTGHFLVLDDSLFVNFNSPTSFRTGPGYILRIKKIASPVEQIENSIFLNSTNCSKTLGASVLSANNNSFGFDQYSSQDQRFICLYGSFYECGWDLTFPDFATKKNHDDVIGNWKCDLLSKRWVNLSSNLSGNLSQDNSPQDLVNEVRQVIGSYSITYTSSTQAQQSPNITNVPLINSTENQNYLNSSIIQENPQSNQIQNLEIQKPEGKITFERGVYSNNSLEELEKNIIISSRKIFVNSTAMPELNQPAILVFTGISFENPLVLKNGENCLNCQILDHSKQLQTLRIKVQNFSTYEVIEDPNPPISNNDVDNNNFKNSGLTDDDSSSSSKVIWIFLMIFILVIIFILTFTYFYFKKSNPKNEKQEKALLKVSNQNNNFQNNFNQRYTQNRYVPFSRISRR